MIMCYYHKQEVTYLHQHVIFLARGQLLDNPALTPDHPLDLVALILFRALAPGKPEMHQLLRLCRLHNSCGHPTHVHLRPLIGPRKLVLRVQGVLVVVSREGAWGWLGQRGGEEERLKVLEAVQEGVAEVVFERGQNRLETLHF